MVDIPLGTEWLGCKLICKNNTYISADMASIRPQLEDTYTPDQLQGNIWLQTGVDELGTKIEETFYLVETHREWHHHGLLLAAPDHNMSCSRREFLKSRWGLPYLEKTRNNVALLEDVPFGANSDFIIQDYEQRREQYDNKSVLILGGGPSVRDVDWSQIDTDFIWASNKFYENPQLQNIRVDSVALTPYVELDDNKGLMDYLSQNPHTEVFFETERGDHEKDWYNMYNFIMKRPSHSLLYATRYRSKLGITPRQICLAIFLGFKDIYLVGLDGQSYARGRHGFETLKEQAEWSSEEMGSPEWLLKNRSKGDPLHADPANSDINSGTSVEKRQFVAFWDYIISLKKRYDFNIINLAEDMEYNMSSEITKWLESHS